MNRTEPEKRREAGQSIQILPKEIDIKLNARQQLFVEKYIEFGFKSGGKAAIAAGFEGKHPYVSASTMLRNPNVNKYLRMRKKLILEEAGVNSFKMLLELARIAFSDVRQLYNADGTLKDISSLSEDAAAAIGGIEVEEIRNPKTGKVIGTSKRVTMNNKLKALEMLMRFKGMFDKDNSQNTTNLSSFNVSLDLGGQPIQITLPNVD